MKRLFIQPLALALLLIVLCTSCDVNASQSDSTVTEESIDDVEAVVKRAVDTFNAYCPLNFDEYMTLNSVKSIGNRTLEHYCIVNVDDLGGATDELKKMLTEYHLVGVRDFYLYDTLRQLGCTFKYKHVDMLHNEIYTISITPEMYNAEVVEEKPKVTAEEYIQRVADDLNRSCPLQVDNITTLTKVTGASNRTLKYYYTVDVDKINAPMEEVKEVMKEQILRRARTNPKMGPLRDMGCIFYQEYIDKNGAKVFSIRITPEEYNKPDVVKGDPSADSIDKVIEFVAYTWNKNCPDDIGNGLIITEVKSRGNHTIGLNMQHNVVKKEAEWEELKEVFEESLLTDIATEEDLKGLRDLGCNFHYTVKDKNGDEVMTVLITPDMYQ